MKQSWDLLIKNAHIVTPKDKNRALCGAELHDLTCITPGYIAIKEEEIVELGEMEHLPTVLPLSKDAIVLDVAGSLVTPGLIDAHTHTVFGGTREEEFVMRTQGADYMEIMEKGGGILRSVQQTRNAAKEDLFTQASSYLDAMLSMGTTTVEIKSGYGLDRETECKQLEVIAELAKHHKVQVLATFLGAHAIPLSFKGNEDAYVEEVLNLLPLIKERNLAQFVDVFCETGVFSIKQSRRILTKAKELGFELRLHADEITNLGGALLAAELRAKSADHLLQTKKEGMRALKEAGVIPILLPSTAFTLKKPYANAREMLDLDLPVALATDFNPGSSPNMSLPFTMALACLYLHLTPEEALSAVTVNAAHSLGLGASLGTIHPGKQADLVIFATDSLRKIPYFYATNQVHTVIKRGKIVVEKERNDHAR